MTRTPAPWMQRCVTSLDRLFWAIGPWNPRSLSDVQNAPRLDALEPRVLFSATPIDPALMDSAESDCGAMVAEIDSTIASQTDSLLSDAQTSQHLREIVIIDASVPHLQQLLDDFAGSDRDLEVFVLDSRQDGVQQISDILDGRNSIDSLHVISHGESGQVKLGNVWLGESNLSGYAGEIASWNAALSSGADLLFYGCDLAGNDSGRTFLDSIAALTDADVNASTNDTGHDSYGADWLLEYATGNVATTVVVSQSLQDDLLIKLNTITVTTTADVVDAGDGLLSLREAILQSSSGDRIELGAGTHGLAIGGEGDFAGDFDISHDLTIAGTGTLDTAISGQGIDRIFDVHSGTLEIENLKLISGNASSDGGAVRVAAAGGVVADQVVIDGNHAAGVGGAISNAGTLALTNVTLSQNTAVDDGGAIQNQGIATLQSVTLSDNASQANGGAIANGSLATSLDLTNVTISGNTAQGSGGGIHSRANASLTHTTLAFNQAAIGGGISVQGASVTLTSTIVSDNSASQSNDVYGSTYNSLGFNLIADTAGVTGFQASDILGHSALLETLADNGGFVQTHALNARSFAIDAAVTSSETVDARGETRARDGDGDTIDEADIGAFELERDTSHIIVVTNISDVVDGDVSSIAALKSNQGSDGGVSLREAIQAINAHDVGQIQEVHFDIAGSGFHRIELGSTLTVTREIILDASTQVGYAIGSPVIVLDVSDAFLTDLLVLKGSDSIVRGFSMVGADLNAIKLDISDRSTIVGNVLGIDVSGVHAGGNTTGIYVVKSDNVRIGGTDIADRNVVSGNSIAGIVVDDTSNNTVIQGNWIGPDLTGQSIARGSITGIHVGKDVENLLIGGTAPGAGNVIGGFSTGIRYAADALNGTVVQGNWIGTDESGTVDLGNTRGVMLLRGNITIGGIGAGEANTIAFSQNEAIRFSASSGDLYAAEIVGNSMYNNGGIGIDLGADGVTDNDYGVLHDTDDGVNRLENFPVLTSATVNNGTLSVAGEFFGELDPGVIIDFYLSDSDNRQGKTYLGFIVVNPDLLGYEAFNATLTDASVAAGQFVVATATHPDGSTSEFSAGVAVTINNSAPTAISLSNTVVSEGIDSSGGLSVGTLSSTDADALDTANYQIAGGGDAAVFSIGGPDGNQLTLTTGVLDFESKSSYEVIVRVTDASGGQFDETFTITVTDRSQGLITVDTTSDLNDTGRSDFDISWLESNKGTDGKISLREAIIAANNTANEDGVDRIVFDIAGGPQHIISLNAALPEITGAVMIDGTTDPSFVDRPIIVLRGNDIAASGLVLADGSSGSTIRGLVIRDFGLNGITIAASSSANHTIQGNWIGGLDALTGADSGDQANGGSGIYVLGNGTTIGGSLADANLIANNQADGVTIAGTGINNTIRFNVIRDNGDLGIDLGDDGITNNDNGSSDSDTGANTLQNYPEIQSAAINTSGDLDISAQFKSTGSSTFVVDFYLSTNDLSGHGEASRWLGSTSTTTTPGGVGNFSHTLAGTGITSGDSVTVTVTDQNGNTSEFAANVSIANANANVPPVLSGIESTTLSFAEDSIPVSISSTLSVSDSDDANLQSASISLVGFVAGQDILDFTNTAQITKSWDAVSGILTLSGNATVAAYQAALRNVTFQNTSDTPDLTSRTLNVTVFDGTDTSNVLSRSVSVSKTNDAPTGAPVIVGTIAENETLSLNTSAIADADGLGTFSFLWKRGTTVVSTASTYTLSDIDVGQSIQAVVNYVDGQGFSESLTSAATGNVTAVNDPATGAPVIVGSAAENQTLSVDTSGISDADGLGAFTYQWRRGATVVSTASTYTLSDDDVGQPISVELNFTDGQGFNESLTSAATGNVTAGNDAATGAPLIIGTATEDQTLSVDTSGVTDADGLGTFGFQWTRGGTVVSTSPTYLLDDPDVAQVIAVTVSFVDGQGFTETLTSASTPPVASVNDVPTGNVTISGNIEIGQTLTAVISAVQDVDGLSPPSFQWYRGGTIIGGATNQTYVLTTADGGQQITVEITYLDGQGTTEQMTSAPTPTIAAPNQPVQLQTAPSDQFAVEDQPFGFTLPAGTFVDPDGDPITYYARTVGGGGLPGWLTFNAATQTFSGTPGNAAVGTVSIEVLASDGPPQFASTTFDITVSNVNDAPQLRDSRRTVPFTDRIVVGPSLFQNASSDVDSTNLIAALVTAPETGSLQLSPDGSFTFTPQDNFFGNVTFQWQASDGALSSNVATVTIVIAPPVNAIAAAPTEPIDPGEGDSLREADAADEVIEEAPVLVVIPTTESPETGLVIVESPGVEVVLAADESDSEDGVFVLDFEIDASLTRRALSAPVSSTTNTAARISTDSDSRSSVFVLDAAGLTEQYAALSDTGEIWKQLDQQQREIDLLLASEKVMVGSVGVATGGFTVGIVAWALRGGFLLSGLLTQLPLWKSLDPMLIMQGVHSDDQDSLEEIMDKEQQALDDQETTTGEALA
ncbi:DUF4347 domain-containing protein [Stieleria varia]|nr:DUF4347 domain-containing protein [Stieleria varia]